MRVLPAPLERLVEDEMRRSAVASGISKQMIMAPPVSTLRSNGYQAGAPALALR